MKKKSILVVAMAAVLIVALLGCSTTPQASVAASSAAPVSTAAASAAPTAAQASTSASASTAASTNEKMPKIGYCVNFMSHEWYQNIVSGAKVRAAELGINIQFADANMDSATQVSQCENLLQSGIDVLVVTPVDPKVLGNIITEAKSKNIPVITESNVVDGAVTFVGIDNKASGKLAGQWLVQYAKSKNITPNILEVGFPALEDCTNRVDGFNEALKESGIQYKIAQQVDGKGVKETAVTVSTDALTAHPDVNVIFGINDDSTTGALQAYKAAGLDESKLTAIGFGFEGSVGQNALLSGGPYKAALAMFPNYVGEGLVDASVKAFNKETLPTHYQTPTIMITQDNFNSYYTKNDKGGYDINFDAVRKLQDQLKSNS
jgi:ABC-type sugar transport system, periplasmic component